jgi:hypothetical protein
MSPGIKLDTSNFPARRMKRRGENESQMNRGVRGERERRRIRDMGAETSMNTTAFDANKHTKIDARPVRS